MHLTCIQSWSFKRTTIFLIIASDGIALALLRKEFPQTLELPSYHVEYAENGANLNGTNTEWPKMIRPSARKKIIQDWVEICDRRYHF
jgi:hypothetical protein